MIDVAPNANFAWTAALLDELARSGVEHLCLCPGSRSAPLAVAAAHTTGLRVFTHVDERSAGFFGLGLARATQQPVALVCTSGTAAANFAPAVAEAFYARVPLLVLTADRPPELRDFGPGQTITQPGIFGAHVRWFHEAPLPEPSAVLLRHARALAARAAARALGPPAGPVHLNLPFREPLHPEPLHGHALTAIATADPAALHGRAGGPFVITGGARRAPDSTSVDRLAEAVRSTPRGAIVCGPLDADPRLAGALARLAEAACWPVLTDVLSGLRSGEVVKQAPLVTAHDAFLRDPRAADALAPELVLRLGDTPTSKATRLWLAGAAGGRTWLVDPDGAWQDPDFAVSDVVHADPQLLVDAVLERLDAAPPKRTDDAWLTGWSAADRAAGNALAEGAEDEPALLEPRTVRLMAELLPEGSTLFLSSSMPVRDADGFLPPLAQQVRILSNRGANGIDGVVSSALGAAAASTRPSVLLTGDLALLHDLGGLLAARRHDVRLAVIVFQNDGGGIFSYLPIAGHGEAVAFEEHFRVRHGTQVRDMARLFDLGYERAESPRTFREALAPALHAGRTTLIEVPVDRDLSVRHHRALWAAAGRAAAEALSR
jgi:2-succinyl-5-enolpyruvyl-6-hydroxy-3-cyclohexene-1-carboxylate synthase